MVGANASHLWVNKRLLTGTNIPVFFYNQNEICGYGPVVSGGTMHLTNACQVLESIKQNWGEVPRQFWQATAISTRPIIHTTSLHSATALAFYHFLTLFLSLSLSLSHTHTHTYTLLFSFFFFFFSPSILFFFFLMTVTRGRRWRLDLLTTAQFSLIVRSFTLSSHTLVLSIHRDVISMYRLPPYRYLVAWGLSIHTSSYSNSTGVNST